MVRYAIETLKKELEAIGNKIPTRARDLKQDIQNIKELERAINILKQTRNN